MKHKFGAIRCEHDGIKFPSRLERSIYVYLKEQKELGNIVMFLRQINFDLPGPSKHSVDFLVFTKDNAFFLEAKGKDLPMGKLKRKQVEDLYCLYIHVATKVSDVAKVLKEYLLAEK